MSIMAPSTRSASRETPPPTSSKPGDYDTITKVRFYNAYDEHCASQSRKSIARQFAPSITTGLRWLHERELHGDAALRRLCKRSTRLGRKSNITKEQCQMLVSPSRNPVRDQLYEVQIKHHNLKVGKRQLQLKLKEHTNGGQRFKQAYIQKVISRKNRGLRTKHGEEHAGKTIHNFWQFVFFTDEAHIDPSSQSQGNILRERGTRYDTENIQERVEKKGVRLHIAAWINWHSKAEKLIFYHDEEDRVEKPKRLPKPRKRKYESKEEFQDRIKEWEALLPHEVEIKPKGNSMTQKYYTERILPVYIKALHKARLQHANPWIFQEDNDPSHGTRKDGLAYQLKQANWIETLVHPPQSPDLNPIEGVWNILKQRIRYRTWESVEDLKEALQEEWSKITMEEVRARIREMPDRCEKLIKSGRGPIRSELW